MPDIVGASHGGRLCGGVVFCDRSAGVTERGATGARHAGSQGDESKGAPLVSAFDVVARSIE